MKKAVLGILFFLSISTCVYFFYKPAKQIFKIYRGGYSIYLQPFSDLPAGQAEEVYLKMKKAIPSLKMAKPLPLPESAWYRLRQRYRADTIIHWLKDRSGDTIIYVGITSKDISTTKDKIVDWGVMGLGFQPGFGCVVSTFRVKKNNLSDQLYKLCLHELGHNIGLLHCPDKNCYMRDAEGQNHLDEETHFCVDCAATLGKRWLHF